MKSVAEAQRYFLDVAAKATETEQISITDALGRICASDVVSNLDIPPQDNSAMDGIAIACSERREFGLSQRIPAGAAPNPLQADTAARIFTGGVIPEGADTVVIQENCTFSDDGKLVTVHSTPKHGDNIRPRGQDIRQGATVVSRGKQLSSVDLSLLSSVGQAKVEVFRKLKIYIFSTGDELVEPGDALQPGQIYNSNRILLKSLCVQAGCELIDGGLVEDTLEATKYALEMASREADLIISSGGVSVGEEDHVKPAVEALGELNFWKVQMKPGKPVAFGNINESKFMGLPGNPVSAFVVFQLLAMPLIKALQGASVELPKPFKVSAAFNKPELQREEYLRVKLEYSTDGSPQANLFPNLSSGVMSSIGWADGLVRQMPNHEICAGDLVDFFPLHSGSLW
ncbi:MAG: gephyrin-like molybdotransferase Glp [Pseudomonadota bacterium]